MAALTITSMHQLAMARLLEYASSVSTGECDLQNLAVISPEIEIYRKYFLDLNGDSCSLYRLALLLLVIANLPKPEQSDITNLSDYLEKYTIYRTFIDEISLLENELTA